MVRQNPVRVGKSLFKSWQFFEKNIAVLKGVRRENAIFFFKALKQLDSEEIDLVSERYYKSDHPVNFNDFLGVHTGVRPVPFPVLVNKLGVNENQLKQRIRAIEIKLGNSVLDARDQQNGISDLSEVVMLFKDPGEIEIINQALAEIQRYRFQNKHR